MRGRAEVARLKQRLDSAFDRFDRVGDDLEVKADFARYLCVLVSGYLERCISELAIEHCRVRSEPTVHDYASSHLRKFQNPNTQRIITLVGQFDSSWGTDVQAFVADERKNAIDSIMALRHQIAHGESVGVTFIRIRDYYKPAQEVIEFLADLFLP